MADVGWPLATPRQTTWGAGARFKAKRPWGGTQTRHHCGVDLGAERGVPVLAPEDLIIVDTDRGWQGEGAKATLVHTASGLSILAGAVQPGSSPKVGTFIKRGQEFARVGQYPGGSTMLHFQLYSAKISPAQANSAQSWKVDAPQPKDLIDPLPYLQGAVAPAQHQPAPNQGPTGRDYDRPCAFVDGQLVCVLPDVAAWAEILRVREAGASAAQAAFLSLVAKGAQKLSSATREAADALEFLVRGPLADHDAGENEGVPANERVQILVDACRTAERVRQTYESAAGLSKKSGRKSGGAGGALIAGLVVTGVAAGGIALSRRKS